MTSTQEGYAGMVALKQRIISFYLSILLLLGAGAMVVESVVPGRTHTVFANPYMITSTSTTTTNTNIVAVIQSGYLTMSNTLITAVPTVILNGQNQLATYTIRIYVTDATGLHKGWSISVTSTAFTTIVDGTPHTLPTNASSSQNPPTVVATGTSTLPTPNVGFPVAIPAALTPPPAVTLYNARADSGMGSFSITTTITLTIPANAHAGTYTSVLTLSIASGP
ncbi:MAG: WxL domain-containing protein [Ktedonobacteraceae bacterium]|nr:WxL domain-containing protein [Ktedonobacteraceae bacterium]